MDTTKNNNHYRILVLSILAFLVMFSYSISRPSTESLFLKIHSSKSLPYVWLLLIASMLGVVYIYNLFVTRISLLKLFNRIVLVSGFTVIVLIFLAELQFPGVYYALYLWKDIYIVLLVDTFYAYANSVFPIKTARWIYGLFGGMGASGGIVGNLLVGTMATHVGSLATLWVVPGVFFIICLITICSRSLDLKVQSEDMHQGIENIRNAFRIVKKSHYLVFVLGLIALTQIVITLIDFEYNGFMEKTFPLTDIRTGMIGRVYASLDAATFILYGFTGPILRLLGIPLTLVFIPFVLGIGVSAYTIVPNFYTVSALKVLSKCFDYTLFKASKEILYIPLSYLEKTRGKSIVDLLTYRSAKGGASILLFILIMFSLTSYVSFMILFLLCIWCIVAFIVSRRFRDKVTRQEEMRGL